MFKSYNHLNKHELSWMNDESKFRTEKNCFAMQKEKLVFLASAFDVLP